MQGLFGFSAAGLVRIAAYDGHRQGSIRAGEPGIDFKRLAVLPHGAREIAFTFEQFRGDLVQARGVGPRSHQIGDRLGAEIGVQAIGDVEHIGILWKGLLQGAHDVQRLVMLQPGVMRFDENQPRLQTPFVVTCIPKALRQGGMSLFHPAGPRSAESQVKLDVGHFRLELQRAKETTRSPDRI